MNILEQLNRELQYCKTENTDIVAESISAIISILEKHNIEVNDKFPIRNVLSRINKFLDSEILFPLTLSEGEFLYVKPNLSVNRRNSNIFYDIKGIYYKNAYSVDIVNVYDSFTGEKLLGKDCRDINPLLEDNPIFLKSGNYISNIYFNKAYLHNSTVNKHSYVPAPPINIKVNLLVHNNRFITFIDIHSDSFKSIKSYYNLNLTAVKKDSFESKELEPFNINYYTNIL